MSLNDQVYFINLIFVIMKKLMNLKGVEVLNKTQQKEVNGAILNCNGNCWGRPQGSRCYLGGHCGCPGACLGGGCVPY